MKNCFKVQHMLLTNQFGKTWHFQKWEWKKQLQTLKHVKMFLHVIMYKYENEHNIPLLKHFPSVYSTGLHIIAQEWQTKWQGSKQYSLSQTSWRTIKLNLWLWQSPVYYKSNVAQATSKWPVIARGLLSKIIMQTNPGSPAGRPGNGPSSLGRRRYGSGTREWTAGSGTLTM